MTIPLIGKVQMVAELSFLSLALVVVMLGVLVDFVVDQSRKASIRSFFGSASDELGAVRDAFAQAEVVRYCAELFDQVYGRRVFSQQRIIASLLSTGFAVYLTTLAVGFDNTVFNSVEPNIESILIWGILIFVLNGIPDYLSLIETRWIFKIAGNKTAPTALLFVLDVILSATIFILPFLLFMSFLQFVGNDRSFTATFFELAGSTFLDFKVVDPSGPGVFFFSTFFTSALWFAASFLSIFVNGMSRLSASLAVITKVVADDEQPGSVLSGMLLVLLFFAALVTQ